jgi:hypothetical protein
VDYPDIAAELDRGDIDAHRAEEKARLARMASRRAEEVPPVSEGPTWEVRHGDFRDVLSDLEPGSVDAIVTDPPYTADALPLWSDLGAFAARARPYLTDRSPGSNRRRRGERLLLVIPARDVTVTTSLPSRPSA